MLNFVIFQDFLILEFCRNFCLLMLPFITSSHIFLFRKFWHLYTVIEYLIYCKYSELKKFHNSPALGDTYCPILQYKKWILGPKYLILNSKSYLTLKNSYFEALGIVQWNICHHTTAQTQFGFFGLTTIFEK